MINASENQGLSDSHHKKECELYDDLSTFMQIFKKILVAIEDIAFNHQKQNNGQMPQERLKQISKQLQGMIKKYAQTSGLLNVQIRTFQRFICRLIETIALYQLKYQNSNTSEISYMFSTLQELEMVIKENQSIQNFVKLIKEIKQIVEKFSILDSKEALRKQRNPPLLGKKFTLHQKVDTKAIKIRNKYIMKYNQKLQDQYESEEQDLQYQVKSATISQKKINYLPFSQSIGIDLQKRFELYRGLDLDFSSFKSSYFIAKSEPQQFYRLYLQRNTQIARLMKAYNDDFSLFQKKKSFRNHRRIASNKHAKNASKQKQFDQKDLSMAESNRSEKKQKTQMKKITVIHTQSFEDINEDDEPTKHCYKMNNIYLTFGKKGVKNMKNPRHYPNITPNLLKQKKQPSNFYFNQSFCPKKDLNITQSIDLQHNQVKLISEMKISQKIKTSPDRYPSFSDYKNQNQIKEIQKSLKEANQMPMKAINRKRYLQLDCTSRKETSLNKVILTGSINVKNIKINKFNDQATKNILF